MSDNNLFKRNPIKTIIIVVFFLLFLIDFLASKTYKIITNRNFHSQVSMEFIKSEQRYRTFSNVYHHDLLKNSSIKNAIWGKREYNIFTNNLGFICGTPNEKTTLSSKKYRILFMGDSFTEGIGVEYNKTFVGIISQALAKRNIETLNAAVASYSPIIYWRKIKYLIENVGLKFDEVIVFIDLSDVRDEALYYTLSPQETVVNRKSTIIEKILYKTENNTIVFHSFLKYIMQHISNSYLLKNYPNKSADWTNNKSMFSEFGEIGLKSASMYMDNLNKLLISKNIRLKIAIYPWTVQIRTNDENSIHTRFWDDWSKKNNVPFYNFFSYFFNYDTLDLDLRRKIISENFIDGDIHWNENGHKMIAENFLNLYFK